MVTPLAGCTPRQAVAQTAARLEQAGCPDAAFDARWLVRLAAGADPLRSQRPLTAEQARVLEELTVRRAAREPLQYLAGRWPFLDFELAVGPGVLCPRADTEVVAEAAAEQLRGVAAPRVLDLCAGTGCLGLGVKRLCPAAQVTALEKSPEAFAYLCRNAARALDGLLPPAQAASGAAAGLRTSGAGAAELPPPDEGGYVRPVQGDLFTFYRRLPAGGLDLIVSNPPYLTDEEMRHLQPEVAREPAMALAAGPDGLVFYRAIAEHYAQALRPGGALALEIGWQQRAAVTALLQAAGWTDIACRQDYGGNDRCILARRPENL